jgi:hypothetical protein
MDNWLASIVGDVDNLHVEIDNLNNPLVRFYFIRSIDFCKPQKYCSTRQVLRWMANTLINTHAHVDKLFWLVDLPLTSPHDTATTGPFSLVVTRRRRRRRQRRRWGPAPDWQLVCPELPKAEDVRLACRSWPSSCTLWRRRAGWINRPVAGPVVLVKDVSSMKTTSLLFFLQNQQRHFIIYENSTGLLHAYVCFLK